MILTETTSLSSAVLPFHTLKEHLRLGTGFVEDDLQDGLLEVLLRAAISAIEARTGVVLLNRGYSWQLTHWRDGTRVNLPKRPISTVSAITIFDKQANATVVDADRYVLRADSQQPYIEAYSIFPSVRLGGSAEITFTAGYGADWADVPSDLGQAVILLAAHFYENRNGVAVSEAHFPQSVETLIAPFRPIRGLRG